MNLGLVRTFRISENLNLSSSFTLPRAYSVLPVKPCVHRYEYAPEKHSEHNQGQSEHCRSGGIGKRIYLSGHFLLYDDRRQYESCGRAQSCHRHLRSHGEGYVSSLEPFGNGSGDGDSRNLAPESEQHASYICNAEGGLRRQAAAQCSQNRAGTYCHECDKYGADYLYSEHVEQDAADHQSAAHAQKTVPACVEPVIGAVPSEFKTLRMLKQLGQCREHVIEKVRCEHRHHQTDERHDAPCFTCCGFHSLLTDVRKFQTVAFLLVFSLEVNAQYEGENSEA